MSLLVGQRFVVAHSRIKLQQFLISGFFQFFFAVKYAEIEDDLCFSLVTAADARTLLKHAARTRLLKLNWVDQYARQTRSSATAKSTARPSCLVGVLYHISHERIF